MSKLEMYSKKLGKTITIKTASANKNLNDLEMMGWIDGGWSRDTGWKFPIKKK